MNGMNQTHGRPMARTLTVTATPSLTAGRVRLDAPTIYLQVNGGGSGTVRIYFSQEAFERVVAGGIAATDQYVEIGPTGLFQGPAYVTELFAVGVGGPATFQVVGYAKIA